MMFRVIDKAFLIGLFALTFFMSGCKIVEDGTVGISKQFGHISDKPLEPGIYADIPVVRVVEVWNTKVTRIPIPVSVPSVDGMTVSLESTVMVRPTDVVKLRKEIGINYQQQKIIPVVNDAIRESIGKRRLDDIIQNQNKLNAEVLSNLRSKFQNSGISIEDHYLTGLQLPQQFQEAVARKLDQEQKVKQKEFELEQARKEADIEIARAEGAARAQEIVRKTISPEYLQYLWISNLKQNPNVIYVATEANMPLFKAVSSGPKKDADGKAEIENSAPEVVRIPQGNAKQK